MLVSPLFGDLLNQPHWFPLRSMKAMIREPSESISMSEKIG
jgi:hypothetical protein